MARGRRAPIGIVPAWPTVPSSAGEPGKNRLFPAYAEDTSDSSGGCALLDPAMSLAKITASMLAASVLALGVGCSGSSATPRETLPLQAPPPEAPSTEPVTTQPLAPATAPHAGAADTLPTVPSSEPSVRKSPMQALNQMVTAQALLVSLLLAPLSKGAAEQPLARVDAPRAGAAAP
jgi:hypothetical protein